MAEVSYFYIFECELGCVALVVKWKKKKLNGPLKYMYSYPGVVEVYHYVYHVKGK